MRSLDASNIMVPVAAYSSLPTADGSPIASPMIAVSQASYQAPLSRSHHATATGISPFHQFLFPAENGFRFNHWFHSFKGSSVLEPRQQPDAQLSDISTRQTSRVPQLEVSARHVTSSAEGRLTKESLEKVKPCDSVPCALEDPVSSDKFSCRSSTIQMNGTEDLTMTGSSNPRADQLNWLTDVASGGNRGTQSLSSSSSPNHDKLTAPGPPVIHGTAVLSPTLLLPSTRSTFNSSLLPTSPNSQRMYTPPYHPERFHLTQHQQSVMGSQGLSLYYTQAPRATPYPPSFYHGQYRPQSVYQPVNSTSIDPSRSRPYFAVDSYPTTMSHTQLPHSAGYLHRTSSSSSSSPVGLGATPSSPLNRTSRNVLLSRSPEEMQQEREKEHMAIHVSPSSPQLLRDERRQSYKSPDPLAPVRQSPVCDSLQSSQGFASDFSATKNLTAQPHIGYRVPTGKEGSLKHRILRPPSINIIDPPSTAVLDAPLSAPPIRSRREPSPKQSRLDQNVTYRSYSTSEPFVLEVPAAQMPAHIPSRVSPTFQNSVSSLSTDTTLTTNSLGSDPQLKYPASFMKGSIIQLANNQLKQVEYLTTEDFIECGSLSSTLCIDSSTVINIEMSPASGSAKLIFSVGQDKLQITVEAPLEHPFFVYKQGWSSCSPERSLLRYGLTCHKLKVGDICISLREKTEPLKLANQSPQSTRLLCTDTVSKLPVTVPTNTACQTKIVLPTNQLSERSKSGAAPCSVSETVNVSTSQNCTPKSEKPNLQKETDLSGEKTAVLLVPSLPERASNLLLQSSLQTNTSARSSVTGKRKRHFSAPDQISVTDGPPSSSS